MSGDPDAVPLAALVPPDGLLRAWLDGSPSVEGIVPPLPEGPDPVAAATADRPPAAPETVAAVVESLESLGAPEASRANAEALGRPGTLAVVAGQQPGLLGGPLYTLLKAAGTIRAAEALTEAEDARGSGRRWVPVFWNASEDHDLEEVDAVVLPDGDGRPRRRRAGLVADGRACRDVSAGGPLLDRLLGEVRRDLPGGPARSATLALLDETRGGSIASWFSRILLRLLGDRGLVVVEPDHLRVATASLLEREVAEPGRLTAAVRRGVEAVRAAGLRPVLDPAREINLFATVEGRRRAVVREGNRFRFEGTHVTLEGDALRERIRTRPREFSANVALRPLVQDAGLPVGVQLAGPTELAYLAELGPAHEDAGIPRALVLPRPAATIVEPRVERALGRLGLGAAEVVADPDRLDDAPPDDAGEARVRRRVEAIRGVADRELAVLLDGSGPEGSGSRRKAHRIARRLRKELERLEGTIVRARREARGVGRRHADRVRHALRPLGRPQERVYGPLPFLARHGTALVDRLLREIDPFAAVHRIVRTG